MVRRAGSELCTIGPSRSAGKKVRAPTRTTTPISRTTKVGLSVRIVPGPTGATFLPARAPAIASTRMIGMKRAATIVPPPSTSAKVMPNGAAVARRIGLDEAGVAGEGRAVVVGLRQVGVQGLGEALGPAGEDRRLAELRRDRERGRHQHRQRREQRRQRGELDLARLDLLAQVLGRPAHHQPADEDRQEDEEQHRVEAGADAAEDHLARAQAGHRHRAAQAGERLQRGVDRAVRGDGRGGRPERRLRDPVALLLALEVAAAGPVEGRGVQAGGVLGRGAVLLGREITTMKTRNSASIAAKIAQPWRWRPTMRPNV